MPPPNVAHPELLELVLEAIGEGIVVADERGQFVHWNAAARRMVPPGPADIGPDRWAEYYAVIDPLTGRYCRTEDLPLVRAIGGEAVDENDLILRDRHTGAERWISVSARPLRDASGARRGGVVVFRDCTERRRMQERIERANESLRSFAHSVSHDLKSPLAVISGFAQALLADCGDTLPAGARDYVEHIEEAATRMSRLIDDLLEHARLGDGWENLVPVDVDKLVHEVRDSFLAQPPAAGRPRPQIHISGELPKVLGFEAGLRQLLQNLISNAIKFVPEGTTPVVHVRGARVDSWVELAVQDNGIGIDRRYHDRIFEVFQRLHPRGTYEGTGIGLAIVAKVVRLHRGHVEVDSAPGAGSTFRVRLHAADHD